ncbi:MAG: hypothetical protein ABI658_30975 [Acidimicrobiales bacterium]
MTTSRKPYAKPVIVSEGKVAELTKSLVGHQFADASFNGDLTQLPISTGPLVP